MSAPFTPPVSRAAPVFWSVFVVVGGLMGIAPLFMSSEYLIRLLAIIFLWIGLAGCWNITSGYTGYIDFGPVVYFGIGSLATGVLMTKYQVAFFPAIAISGAISAVIALPMGIATLRLRGAYFAIATFAFAETMKQVVLEFDRTFHVEVFHGSHGITLPLTQHSGLFFFYVVFAVTLGVILVHYLIETSKFGYGLKAIHEAEIAAEISGVDTTGTKLRAYCIAAAFLGVYGGIEAYWTTYITPSDVFSVQKTVQMVIMTLLGGMGTILGPVIGAASLTVLSEALGTRFVEYYLIMVGAIIVVVILIMPQGIIGTIKAKLGLRFI